MKRILLILSGLGFFLGHSFAQISIRPAGPITLTGSYSAGSVLTTNILISNAGGSNANVKVLRIVLDTVAGTTNNFCFGPACYPPSVSLSPVATAISPGGSDSSFTTDYNPNGNAGITKLRFLFFNTNNANDTASIIITYDARTLTAVSPLALKTVFGSPYPNPTTGPATVSHRSFGPGEQASVGLYDILGNHLSETTIEPFTVETALPTSNLRQGAYICKYTLKGKTIGTKRLTVVR